MEGTSAPGLRGAPRQIECVSLPALRVPCWRHVFETDARTRGSLDLRSCKSYTRCAGRLPDVRGELLFRFGGNRQVAERPFGIFIVEQCEEDLTQVVGSELAGQGRRHFGCCSLRRAFDLCAHQVGATSRALPFAACATLLIGWSIAIDRRSLPSQLHHHR